MYARYAIYYVPEGPLAEFGARGLGWDIWAGQPSERLHAHAEWVKTPRKYGFHGTLKPPFRLAPDREREAFFCAARALASAHGPVQIAGLELAQMGALFALVPKDTTEALAHLARAAVQELDAFRAPASEAELAKRRARPLTARQEAMLTSWGYPYVFDEFRFHLTLTGRVLKSEREHARAQIERALPDISAPLTIDAIALVGERSDGAFEVIERLALTG